MRGRHRTSTRAASCLLVLALALVSLPACASLCLARTGCCAGMGKADPPGDAPALAPPSCCAPAAKAAPAAPPSNEPRGLHLALGLRGALPLPRPVAAPPSPAALAPLDRLSVRLYQRNCALLI